MPCNLCCRLTHHIEDDWSIAVHQDALQCAAKRSADFAGDPEPDLEWASWRNLGPATSPPFGVFFDHARKEIMICIRGTADLKDCITDAVTTPEFFDPFREAEPGDARRAPFDNEKGLFAHQSILIAEADTYHRLRSKRILETALSHDGKAKDYTVVCVGHSLGSGVACLLALMLKADLYDAKDVRF